MAETVREIGIDLGTTNSAVAYMQSKPVVIENQGQSTTPSVVAYDEGEILVGQPAKDLAIVLGAIRSVKRSMGTDKRLKLGDKEYLPEEISAMILRELKRVAEERLEGQAENVVITIPAYFAGAQVEATKRAGEIAGFRNIKLLAEPVAAALAFRAEHTVMVYDLGGGTFDTAIIDCFDYHMVGLAGDNFLGGDDFDECLMARLSKEVKDQQGVDPLATPESRQLAKSVCEKAKIDLSKRERTTIVYQTVVQDKPINVRLVITREEFEDMVMHLVDRTLELVDRAIEKAKEKDPDFSKDHIETVLLVGGSTYIPLVRKKVEAYFGKAPSTKVNADLAVTYGAAIAVSQGVGGGHQIVLAKGVPEATPESEYEICGRTTAGAKVEVRGGIAPVSAVADERGKFSLVVRLTENATNDLELTSTSPSGEVFKREFCIRHDTDVEQPEEELPPPPPQPVTPRSLGVNVTGDDCRFGVIIPEQTDIPCRKVCRDYCTTSQVPNMPGAVPIEIYEGELPHAPLNTHLATLTLETPPVPGTAEPLEITFQITEDRLLEITARMVNYPDRKVEKKIQYQSAAGTKLCVTEWADRLLNQKDRLRPEDRARISQANAALKDLAEQFKRNPEKERYERIKQTGLQLRADLERLDATLR